MNPEVYRYTFSPTVSFEDVEGTLVLALMAAESLHGQSQVRLDSGHATDAAKRRCVIDASTRVGSDLNRLFIGFASREFGPDAFQVERIAKHQHQPQEMAA